MLDSPIRVTVSQIRQRILASSPHPPQGPEEIATGIFEGVVSGALDPDQPACWETVLTSSLNEEEWLASLYQHLLGPELARLQPSLAESGAEVLGLWEATRQFVSWFARLLEQAAARGELGYDGQTERWQRPPRLFQSECEVAKVFEEPGWSSPVMVCGRLDQFLRHGADRWSVIRFRAGDSPATDAAQACLYHELLGDGQAALVDFGCGAQLREASLSPRSILDARPELMALIGALAGVAPGRAGSPPGIPAPVEDAQEQPLSWPRRPGEEEAETGERLKRTLREYGAEAEIASEPLVGPTFVRYLLEPLEGVTVSRIERRAAELQVRLELEQEPVIHRVEGRIAVDVPRRRREFVDLGSIQGSLMRAAADPEALPVPGGVDLRGKIHLLDLARDCPHILVGGRAGSGKTEWLRSAVAGLILTRNPATLRLALVDPRRNAFAELSGSPRLWKDEAFIDSPDSSVLALVNELIAEISRRNSLFKASAADDLAACRRRTGEELPRIVLVVDEIADLVLSGGRKQRDQLEEGFIRIAQTGRAAGVHLILATQRPSRQVVSGNLKANLPGRIALRVATRVDSGVLIDQPGAELLLGKGDLLLAGLSSEPLRLQSAWLGEDERRSIFREEAVAAHGHE